MITDVTAAALLIRQGALARTTPRGLARLARGLLSGRQDLYLAIEAHAVQTPDRLAVADARRSLTWRALDHQAATLAGGLAAMGLVRGDRVAIFVENRVEFFVIAAACSRIGATPMPSSPLSAPEQVTRRLQETHAAAAFVEAPLAEAAVAGIASDRVIVLDGPAPAGATPWVRAHASPFRARFRPRQPATDNLILFTSGTTGRSRGTRIATERAGPLTALRYLHAFRLTPDAVFFTPCPLYHAAPLVLSGLTLTIGGTVVVRPRFDDPVDTLLACGATHAFLVPTLSERLSRLPAAELARLRAGPLRALLSGGAALRPALKRKLLDQLGPVLYDFYGATELGIVSVAGPAELAWDPATVGRVLPGVEIRLVDDEGRAVPPGEPGLLEVRGPSVSDGYLGEGSHPVTRWHTAGDVCRQRDGLLYVVDRKRDVIISGGVNIFPVDVEEAVEAHPSVREAAALGVTDPEWGEALHVFVVLEPGHALDSEALIAHCRARLQRYAVPKAFHAIGALPRSPTGKVLRRELRARLVTPAR